MRFILAKKLLLLALAGHASATFDAWTTRRLLSQHAHDQHPAYEANPVLRPFAGNSTLYGVIQADAVLTDALLSRSKHRRLAVGITVGIAALHVAAAAHNLAHQAALEQKPILAVTSSPGRR
jgi:hypothetical protein